MGMVRDSPPFALSPGLTLTRNFCRIKEVSSLASKYAMC